MQRSFATGTPEAVLDQIMSLVGGVQPVTSGYGNMLESALKGEATGATVPIIQQAVERSRQAGSRALQGTTDELARTGLAGTPFGQSILSQTRQQGAQAASQAGTDVMTQLIAQIPAFLAQNASTISALTGVQGPSGSYGTSTGYNRGQSTSVSSSAGYGQSRDEGKKLHGGVGGGKGGD